MKCIIHTYTRESYSEMGHGCLKGLSYSAVPQHCLQCEILKFQERTHDLCDPCTVLFVFIYWLYNTALLEDCINKQYKCVILLLFPKPSYFVLDFIGFHADKLHFFVLKNIYYIFETSKAQFSNVNIAWWLFRTATGLKSVLMSKGMKRGSIDQLQNPP